ncbi:OmpP1/FadL family transporter [Flavobacterium sp. GT3R68]|uniref:OmpP1/FadL family transporter n=1 Tax=Flavobacterium sp. GT3R68 TaxID=2594437 RepID=UPI000F8782B4|nr:outer membrane protein transport protein [Flavobacterium sp. GT3R68]RTY86625.1 transporter [Flavobacterium sp. GSN2]TRW92340.1 transporter [Flavobacterium sp. GT3R68]
MEKYLTLIIAALSFTAVQSQDITDAMRYAQDNTNGTARFRAMSGAFGALGGDFSALNVNPAGSAVFNNNQIGLTLNSYHTKNESTYFGTKNSESNFTLDLNQAGAVFVFKNDDEKSDWKKFTLALNYENTNKYDNSLFYSGTNPTNSVADYFLYYAEGIPLSALQNSYYDELNLGDQQAFLGVNGHIITPVDPNSGTYESNVPPGGNYYQENSFESTGYNGKLAFNAAAQYKDKFYFGLNLNTHFSDYRQATLFHEDNNNSTTEGVRSLDFANEVYTYGTGFSFQLGAIAKVTKEFRLGVAYESPTWYELTDERYQILTTRGFNYDGNPALSNATPDSDVVLIYDPYKLQTPGKWTGSFAYVFGKTGLLSIDYSLKDYSNTQYRPKDNYFRPLNNQMAELLDVSSEIRIGGEYKINQWSLRGGYRIEQSPYKDGKTVGDLTGYSGGLGYNFGSTRLDVAYSRTERDIQKQSFSHGFTDSAKINSINDNVTVTLTFEL